MIVKNVFVKIEELTKIDRDNVRDVFKKYTYQYGSNERYLVSMVKVLMIFIYSFINIFKKTPKTRNAEIIFDASIKRLSFSEVYTPIIDLFPNSKWQLLARSKDILRYNVIKKCMLLEQKNVIARYITLDTVKTIISIILLRIGAGKSIPLNHYFLFIQEYLYFEYLMKLVDFKVFVSFRDSSFTPAMYGVLKKHDVTTITLQHGFFPKTDPRKNMKYNHYQYLFTFSEVQSDVFLNVYQSRIEHIKNFGSPLLNNKIVKLKHKNVFDLCFIEQIGAENYLRLDDMIFLLGTVLEYAKDNGLSIVYCNRFLRSRKSSNKKCINERLDKIDMLLERYPFVVRSDDSYQSIFDSKLTVTKNSTMGLEAIGMGKCILICDFYASIGFTGLYPKKNKLFFVYDMSKDAIINGLEEVFTADSEYLNSELERIKPYYMNTNPNEYFNNIENIISNRLTRK
jgi:hypothetical protein